MISLVTRVLEECRPSPSFHPRSELPRSMKLRPLGSAPRGRADPRGKTRPVFHRGCGAEAARGERRLQQHLEEEARSIRPPETGWRLSEFTGWVPASAVSRRQRGTGGPEGPRPCMRTTETEVLEVEAQTK